jgi:hypothetical protein
MPASESRKMSRRGRASGERFEKPANAPIDASAASRADGLTTRNAPMFVTSVAHEIEQQHARAASPAPMARAISM